MRTQRSRSVLSCYQGWGGRSSSFCCPQPSPAPARPAECCQAAPRLVTLGGNGNPAACMHPGHLAPSPSWARWDRNFVVLPARASPPQTSPPEQSCQGTRSPAMPGRKGICFPLLVIIPSKHFWLMAPSCPGCCSVPFTSIHTAPVRAASLWQIHTFFFFISRHKAAVPCSSSTNR